MADLGPGGPLGFERFEGYSPPETRYTCDTQSEAKFRTFLEEHGYTDRGQQDWVIERLTGEFERGLFDDGSDA
jgi:hypothetical protein